MKRSPHASVLRGYFLLCTILLLSNDIFSQAMIPVWRIDSLPQEGIALNRGWKFHAGDDTSWANPLFNDSAWQPAVLGNNSSFPAAFKNNRTGWFRIRLVADSQVAQSQMALALSQLGASEVYVNGSLFLRLGAIYPAAENRNDNPHGKPFLFRLNPGDTTVMAIRFSSSTPSKPWLFARTGMPPLSVTISPWSQALSNFETALQEERIPFGFSFMSIGLGIFFLLVYFFSPEEKLDLLFGAFCLFAGMIPVIRFQMLENNLSMSSYGWFFFLSEFIDKVCAVLLLSIVSLTVFGRLNNYQRILILYFLVVDTLIRLFLPPSGFTDILVIAGRTWLAVELVRLGLLALMRSHFFVGVASFISGLLNLSFTIRFIAHKDLTAYYTQFNFIICFVLIGIYFASQFGSKPAVFGKR